MDILGLNFSIDAAAALVRDGSVIAASQEERFSRIKHDSGFPDRSIQFCLQAGNIGLSDLDAVAFFWNPGIHAAAPTTRFASRPRHQLEFLYNVPVNLIRTMGIDDITGVDQTLHLGSGKPLTIHYLTHHLCHAAAAFYTSPFDESAILTADGYGERHSTLIAHGRGTGIEVLDGVEYPHSLGALYAAITQYLGFRPNSGEGKVMGLASYGQPSRYVDLLSSMIVLTERGFRLDLTCFEFFHDRPARYNAHLIDLLGPARDPESDIDQRHMDIAYALQAATENALLHLAAIAKKRTGSKRLCMAGGVGLNCVANGRLARESNFESFFFYPSAGDSGTAVGAALWAWHGIYGGKRTGEPASEYLGPSYKKDEISKTLEASGAVFQVLRDPETRAAEMIADGLIIGWFQGRSEFGPRALGNRSILADPRRPDMKDVLNSRVKHRESFRPYAPSILEEACGDFFSSGVPSPYMLRAYHTLDDKVGVLPAITHVDGTARVQTVTEAQNPKYYRLIKRFGELTGVPVVLNTSFNIRGEPIVNTVEDALKCYYTTGLDALIIEDYLLVKDGSS